MSLAEEDSQGVLETRVAKAKQTAHELLLTLARVRSELRAFGIRDASDYAEVLVARALGGERAPNRVTQGYDVLCPKFGRVEVKCRQLPNDGRTEERVQVGAGKERGFDFLAIVVFEPDFRVKGALLVPYRPVWELVSTHVYNRISYAQARGIPSAIDITLAVSRAVDCV